MDELSATDELSAADDDADDDESLCELLLAQEVASEQARQTAASADKILFFIYIPTILAIPVNTFNNTIV